MSEPPNELMSALPAGTDHVARQWWSSLSEQNQRQLADLWDNRLEVCFFSPQSDSNGRSDEWSQVPKVVGGRFVPTDDTSGIAEWGPEYFEYLLLNPELVLAYEPAQRTFHIGCRQHAAARECIAKERIPPAFTCPIGSVQCPFEALRGSSIKRHIPQ
jgi:hypothetical protein